MSPRRSQQAKNESQERPTRCQEGPRRAQEEPKKGPRRPKTSPWRRQEPNISKKRFFEQARQNDAPDSYFTSFLPSKNLKFTGLAAF